MKRTPTWLGGRVAGLMLFSLVAVCIGTIYGWPRETLVVVGLLWLIRFTSTRLALVLGGCASLYIFFWGLWLVCDRMTGVGINQAVIFHLFSGIQGADYSQFVPEIMLAVAFLAGTLATLVYAYFIAAKARTGPGSFGYAFFSLGIVTVLTGWLLSPWQQDIAILSQSYAGLGDETQQRLYHQYNIEPREIRRKRNLVVIYLESVESTYFDQSLFPGLLPRLTSQRGESHYFSGIAQGPGAGWTIAGLVSSQCGVPLVTPGAGINEMGNIQHFLPEAKCLAEHLQDNGYQTLYMGGASGQFAGKGGFLQQHGFNEVRDKRYFEQLGLPESAFSGWGVYDEYLLNKVYAQYVRLSQRPQPFALFTLTMDTHHPHGYISPRCAGLKYGDGEIKTLNALHCADRLVSRLIDKIRTSPYYDDTTLVVMSDHLAMINDAKELLAKAEKRENLLMIFDPLLAAGEQQVEATTVDIGATLLDLLDADITQLGFGRSLLAQDEKAPAYSARYHGSGDVSDYLVFSRQLWNMPSIAGVISTDGNGHVRIGESLLNAPFLTILDNKNNLTELYFKDFQQHIDTLKQGTRYIHALLCQQEHNAASGVCLVSGSKGVDKRSFTSAELLSGIRAADML